MSKCPTCSTPFPEYFKAVSRLLKLDEYDVEYTEAWYEVWQMTDEMEREYNLIVEEKGP